jgi:NitT/TauT family transport system substrate-binding protein
MVRWYRDYSIRGIGKWMLLASILTLASVNPSPLKAQSSGAKACEKVDKIKVHDLPGVITNLVFWVAQKQQFFAKYCLEATPVFFASGTEAYAASIQGGVDFIETAPDTGFVPASQGLDIKFVAAHNSIVYFAMVLRKGFPTSADADLATVMKALVGKKVGVNRLGTSTDEFGRANFKAVGIDPDSATWVAYGPLGAGIAALLNGSVDAAEFFGDGADVAAAASGGRIVGDLRDPKTKALPSIAALNGANVLWTSPTAFIKKNPALVARFKKVNDDSVKWIQDPANFQTIVDLVQEKSPLPEGVPESVSVERVKNYLPQISSKVSLRAMKAWADYSLQAKRIPEPIDVESMIWEGARDMMVP